MNAAVGADRRGPPGRHRRWGGPLLALVALAATACGTDLVGSATTSAPLAAGSAAASSTTVPSGEVAVAFPVVGCTTGFGTPPPGQSWKASILLAPIPTALVGRVEFYTDGPHAVLAPSGWSCVISTAPDGATDLSVEPPGESIAPTPGTQGVFATFDTTGRPAGAALVCPFFAIPQWQQQEADCDGQKPPGEFSSLPTPDVATVYDPAGVSGSLAASGGARAVGGTVIFPQVTPAVSDGSSIDVAVESCALVDTSLCATVLADFEVREFPIPGGLGGSR